MICPKAIEGQSKESMVVEMDNELLVPLPDAHIGIIVTGNRSTSKFFLVGFT